MSLINDALKRAQQTAPPVAPDPLPATPLQPVTHPAAPMPHWLIPAFVILLLVAGIFFVGLATAHHPINRAETGTIAVPAPVATPVARVTTPTPPAGPTAAPPAMSAPATPPAIQPSAKPKLQGIFYSSTAPSAIVDGKTVRPGDQFLQYRVREITPTGMVLTTADGKAITLSMDN